MDTKLPSAGTFQRSQGLLAAEAGDELLMMSVELGLYFNLNAVGSRSWALLEEPRTLQEMAAVLRDEYEVSAETVDAELRTFLGALYQRELLVVSDVQAG